MRQKDCREINRSVLVQFGELRLATQSEPGAVATGSSPATVNKQQSRFLAILNALHYQPGRYRFITRF